MAYTKTEWKARQGTGLNRFKKSREDEEFIYLDNEPEQITEPGTSFSTEKMNNIEDGIYDAHEAVSAEEQARFEGDENILADALGN
jgi:pyruvate dehydrogenase complex dehydrogenase (E1) component